MIDGGERDTGQPRLEFILAPETQQVLGEVVFRYEKRVEPLIVGK